jgi:membrane fusion protein (multidrug efflux system)
VKLVRSEGQALMIPEQAIVPEDTRHYVYVVSDGSAHKREITIGRRRPGEVEVLSGLTPDESIVVDGTLNLRDGAAVREQNDAAPGTASEPT